MRNWVDKIKMDLRGVWEDVDWLWMWISYETL
jgi:hypothetical protein